MTSTCGTALRPAVEMPPLPWTSRTTASTARSGASSTTRCRPPAAGRALPVRARPAERRSSGARAAEIRCYERPRRCARCFTCGSPPGPQLAHAAALGDPTAASCSPGRAGPGSRAPRSPASDRVGHLGGRLLRAGARPPACPRPLQLGQGPRRIARAARACQAPWSANRASEPDEKARASCTSHRPRSSSRARRCARSWCRGSAASATPRDAGSRPARRCSAWRPSSMLHASRHEAPRSAARCGGARVPCFGSRSAPTPHR